MLDSRWEMGEMVAQRDLLYVLKPGSERSRLQFRLSGYALEACSSASDPPSVSMGSCPVHQASKSQHAQSGPADRYQLLSLRTTVQCQATRVCAITALQLGHTRAAAVSPSCRRGDARLETLPRTLARKIYQATLSKRIRLSRV